MRHVLGQEQRHARTNGSRHRTDDHARLGSGGGRAQHENEHAARLAGEHAHRPGNAEHRVGMPRAVPARIGHGDPQHAKHERVRDVFKGDGKRVELAWQHRQSQCTQSGHGNLDTPQQREAEPTAAPDSPIHHEKRQSHHAKLMERAQRRPHGDGLARRISARNAQRKAKNGQPTEDKPCSCLWLSVIDGLGISR